MSDWHRLEELFDRASGLSHAEQKQFVDELEEQDSEIASELALLLACGDEAEQFMEHPVSTEAPSLVEAMYRDLVSNRPNRVGPYRILDILGEGGMSVVYLAEQEKPVFRKVALKVMRERFCSGELLARFRQEWQLLATMNHSFVAKIYDAASFGESVPYLVMELIDGPSITEYCDAHEFALAERISLFISVCEGVKHAHQKAIIHRDLKPSNILVVEQDGKPIPKIIDFGVAKNLGPVAGEVETLGWSIIGTPIYMSPEQACAETLTVDTRSDIYSLSVLLYELLTGLLPFDTKEMTGNSLEETLRLVRETEPPVPSARLKTSEVLINLAASRKLAPRRLIKALAPDLDAIVMKGMAKEPERRYETVSDLKDDLNRYLEQRPIYARPLGLGYYGRKFLLRHKVSVLTGSLVLVALIAGLILAALGFFRASQALRQLQVQHAFLEKLILIEQLSPNSGSETTMVEAFQFAEQNLESSFKGFPNLEASTRILLGRSYYYRGRNDEACNHFLIALVLKESTQAPLDEETFKAMDSLARIFRKLGDYPTSEQLFERSLMVQAQVQGRDHPDRLSILTNLALTEMQDKRLDAAEERFCAVLDAQMVLLGLMHQDTAVTLGGLANCLRRQNRYEEAESFYRQAEFVQNQVLEENHTQTLVTRNNLANCYAASEKFEKARAIYEPLAEIRRHKLGDFHPDTLSTRHGLGLVLRRLGKLKEAEALYVDVIQKRAEVFGPQDPKTLQSMNIYALVLASSGNLDEAIDVLEYLLDIYQQTGRGEQDNALKVMNNLGKYFLDAGLFADGIGTLEETLALKLKHNSKYRPTVWFTLIGLGEGYQKAGFETIAEEYFQAALVIAEESMTIRLEETCALLMNPQSTLED